MKKLIALIMVLCLLPATALAESEIVTVHTSDLKLTFRQPEDTFVLTRDSSEDDFNACGKPKDEWLPQMVENGHLASIYWNGKPENAITMVHAVKFDAGTMDETMGNRVINEYPPLMEADGFTVEQAEYLQTDGLNYVRFLLWQDTELGRQHEVSYMTWLCGYQIMTNTYAYDMPLSESLLASMEEMMRSMTCEAGRYSLSQTGEDEDGDIVVTLPGAAFFFTPVKGYCLTRESSASAFNRLGLSQREELPFMEEYDIYALLYDEAMTSEIQVIAYESQEIDFDEMTAFGEQSMLKDFRFIYEDWGYTVESLETYLAPEGHRFIRIESSYMAEDGNLYSLLEYITCQAGYTVAITLYPWEGSVTQTQIDLGEQIADSLWITPIP